MSKLLFVGENEGFELFKKSSKNEIEEVLSKRANWVRTLTTADIRKIKDIMIKLFSYEHSLKNSAYPILKNEQQNVCINIINKYMNNLKEFQLQLTNEECTAVFSELNESFEKEIANSYADDNNHGHFMLSSVFERVVKFKLLGNMSELSINRFDSIVNKAYDLNIEQIETETSNLSGKVIQMGQRVQKLIIECDRLKGSKKTTKNEDQTLYNLSIRELPEVRDKLTNALRYGSKDTVVSLYKLAAEQCDDVEGYVSYIGTRE